MSSARTALILPVPEAEPHVATLRRERDPMAALGVPAHITVLFPFAPLEEIEREVLRALVASVPSFPFRLERVGTFEGGTVWLEPVPRSPFADLTRAVWRQWPRYPPYGGAHAEIIPHLTVSAEPVEVDVPLPIPCRAREIVLLREADGDRWRAEESFPLGPPEGRGGR